MRKVPIDEIEDNMELAKPLTRSDGKILMAAGVKLKSTMASRLKNWGVGVAYVVDEGGDSTEDVTKRIEGKLKALENTFSGTLENLKMKHLYEVVKEHIKKHEC